MDRLIFEEGLRAGTLVFTALQRAPGALNRLDGTEADYMRVAIKVS